ncbi:Helicase SWR1 [Cladobotryum mycophilum]|uniref:Helicase SWR1 n=1 Tax=Cladobotryum mycophilum TaxID=491253 RepID=A0ABR0SI06_9HYPO
MPETASPNHVLPNADHQADAEETNFSAANIDDSKSLETVTKDISAIESQTNGHAEPNATPSSKTNGHVLHHAEEANGHHGEDDERPAKRQRTRDVTPPPLASRKLKPISPPWKKIEADGPTTYLENGRRKSGRLNLLPIELLPPPPTRKRTTRHSINGTNGSTPKKDEPATNGKSIKTPISTPKLRTTSKPTPAKPAPDSISKSTSKKAIVPEPRSAPRLADDTDTIEQDTPINNSKNGSHDVTGRSPRIRLKIAPRSNVIPLVHPDQVRKRPRIAKDFDEYWQRAGTLPVEEGGLLVAEDGPPYTDEMAQKDARIVLRIEDEVEPGGFYQWDDAPFSLQKAMSNFRKLMLAEQQRHRSTAKKLAEACREEWLRRQPKSVEVIEAEEREKWAVRYRVVIKALSGTWENVRTEVNRRRMEQWEAEEQRRVKAALNQAVSLSEQKLQARQAGGIDSEVVSDEDGFDDMSDAVSEDDDMDEDSELLSRLSEDGDGKNEDSDVMSSSSDEEDEETKDAADENLTQEQLRAKYANIPDLEPSTTKESTADPAVQTPKDDITSGGESSDESVDMDDDLGSSELEDSDASERDGSSDDESGSDEEDANGLLGLLFGKSELKEIKKHETPQQGDAAEQTDVEMSDAKQEDSKSSPAAAVEPIEDEDAVSLVHHPDSLNGDEAVLNEMTPPPEQDAVVAKDESLVTITDAKPTTNGIHSPPEIANNDTVMTDNQDSSAENTSLTVKPTTSKLEEPPAPEAEPINGDAQPQKQPPPMPDKQPSETDATNAKVSKSNTAEPSPAPSTHKIEVPFLLRGTLREYQRQGLDWLAGLYSNNTNGILADEMGLGKTIQTIALLAHLACEHEVWGPHLVIVPTSVMLNWEMEFKKWCPGFKILAYYGSQEERKRKRQGWNNDDVWNVCVTSYQLVLQDQQVFRRRRWHYMILDEAHNIKNFKSQRWQTLLGFNTHSRLLLTGTPLQNNLTELWSLLFFLMPAENGVGGFADLQEFHDWFRKPESQILENGRDQMDDEAKAIISKLHKVLRPYLLRRLKADVEKQMPAKYEHVEFCRLSKRQRELYDGFLARSDTRDTLSSGNYLSIINCLMQLRKVCNHPDLFVDRPIMTSFRMRKSIVAEYDPIERTVRRTLLAENPMAKVNLGFLNLVPTQHEHLSTVRADSIAQLSSHRALMELREAQKSRAQNAYTNLDPSTVESNIAYLESAARWGRFEELQHCVYLNALRRQQRPIYGKNVVDLVTLSPHKRASKPRSKVPQKIIDWFESDTDFMRALTPSLNQRAHSFKTTIEKFSCVTPAVVTRDLNQFVLGRKGVETFTDEDLKLSAPVRWAPFIPKQSPPDPWHEARMRLTIQFPDRRLLQYDCGKLQALDKLLRKLQAGGHRALIFTQMTKVLDILEQFLNIHGHKYLRLDGATKVEQRQILTDRFNHDSRILCFILSTRSGGLGINLTGADTVIFYDQDWNPAMDKQCQDRCHRIGQTRDVHIYRLVSEHTIEANILRKASQKQMLDDVVIQEGEFNTDSFNKPSIRDVLGEKVDFMSEGVAAADAALDLVLGGSEGSSDRRVGRVFEQAEDKEDVDAARVAEKEIQADDADFTEKAAGAGSGASTTRQGTPAGKSILDGGIGILDGPDVADVGELEEYNAWGDKLGNIDEYMLSVMMEQLKHTKLELPKDKKKGKKKGKDTRKR